MMPKRLLLIYSKNIRLEESERPSVARGKYTQCCPCAAAFVILTETYLGS